MALQWYENGQRWPWDLYDNPIRVYIDIVSISFGILILLVIFIGFIWFMYFKDYNNVENHINQTIDLSNTQATDSPHSPSSNTELSIINTIQNRVRKRADIHNIAKILSAFCIFFAIIFLCLLLMIVIFAVNGHQTKCIYISLCYEIVFIQRLCLYLYYLFRAYLTMKDSIFATNEHKLGCTSILVCILWICGGIFYILYMSVLNTCNAFSIMIGIIPAAIFESMTSIGCLLFFLWKLQQLLKTSTHPQIIVELQYILSKITILATVTVITSFIIFSIFPFTFVQGLWAIDSVINVLCLVLSFKFYDTQYKSFCTLCRRCCQR